MGFRLRTALSIGVAVIVTCIIGALVFLSGPLMSPITKKVTVLSYSSFTAPWGPAGDLVQQFQNFKENEGIEVQFVQADDAGILLAKVDAFAADLVVGLDQYGVVQARLQREWLSHGLNPKFSDEFFLAFDWAPIGLIFRSGEAEPPLGFDDLLKRRYEKKIAWLDPRTSSPGLQVLMWLIEEKGEDGAFEFLRRLKPNIQSVSRSWSQAYAVFTRGFAELSFGYATSPLYHLLNENDSRYSIAVFSKVRHPIQVEYAAIPASCVHCSDAKKFLSFLVSPEAQKILMQKNWMLPVVGQVAENTPFAPVLKQFQDFSTIAPNIFGQAQLLTQAKRDHLFKRWKELDL